jgi:hypothetical protein
MNTMLANRAHGHDPFCLLLTDRISSIVKVTIYLVLDGSMMSWKKARLTEMKIFVDDASSH